MNKVLITTILWLVLLIGSFFFGKDIGQRVCEAKYLEEGLNNQNSANKDQQESNNLEGNDHQVPRKLGVIINDKIHSVSL